MFNNCPVHVESTQKVLITSEESARRLLKSVLIRLALGRLELGRPVLKVGAPLHTTHFTDYFTYFTLT